MRISVNNKSAQPKIVHRLVTLKEASDGVSFKLHKAKVSFKLLPREEADQLSSEAPVAFLKEVVVGWGDPQTGKGGFEDEDGNPLPFNDEMMDAVCSESWRVMGLIRGYFDASLGGRAGNLLRRFAIG